MRRRTILATLAALLLLPGVVHADKKWQKIKSPAMHPIQPPKVQRHSLDNGVQLFVLEDHELPLFRMTLVMKVGDSYVPKDKLGLAGITAEVLRSGGSTTLSGDALDELLENRGGSIETRTDELTTTISVDMLVEDTDRALEILRDLLLHPAYPEDKLDLAVKQSRSAIARRNDDPGEIADREFNKILYGKDHPFAAQVEYEHLAHITRADLIEFHTQWYQPADASIALWGDFDPARIVESVQRILGQWPKKAVQHPPTPEIPQVTKSVNLVVKESVNQSNVRLGQRSIRVDDPNYYPLLVMNELLGGGLGSRLFNEVRSRQGLAYHVGSSLGAHLAYPGMFEVDCGTKSGTTVKAIRACIEEVRKMQSQPVTEAELQRAKDGLLNSYVFNFANRGAIVNRIMQYVRNGYPEDFLEKFPAEVAKVTAADVQKAAGTFLQPDNLALLVVGKPADFDEQLSALGTVNTIDITIPEPPAVETYPEPTPATQAKGKEILAQSAKAVGGITALDQVNNITESQDVQVSLMGNKMSAKATRYVQFPGHIRVEIAIMGSNMVQVYNREEKSGYVKSMMGSKTFDEAQMQDQEDELARELVAFLRDAETYDPQYIGEDKVDGAPADVVLLSVPTGGRKFKVFVDKASHLVVKLEYQGKNMQGSPVHQEVFLSSYKPVGKLKLPHKSTIHQDGEFFLEAVTTSISTTNAIPAEKFAKAES